MKVVKTQPRFRCDFCRRVATLKSIARHEKICFQNPDRYCDLCGNKGSYYEGYGEGLGQTIDCFYCSQMRQS